MESDILRAIATYESSSKQKSEGEGIKEPNEEQEEYTKTGFGRVMAAMLQKKLIVYASSQILLETGVQEAASSTPTSTIRLSASFVAEFPPLLVDLISFCFGYVKDPNFAQEGYQMQRIEGNKAYIQGPWFNSTRRNFLIEARCISGHSYEMIISLT